MRDIHFYKYQGTGNDFIILDQLDEEFNLSNTTIQKLCDRRFGIGADGLMLLRNEVEANFKMIYYNADGNESSMCGNGGRCISHLYFHLSGKDRASFSAIDGLHESILKSDGRVALKMSDVEMIQKDGPDYVINTGSPHFIKCMESIKDLDVVANGQKIRYNEHYKEEGINVNFLKMYEENIAVRTYERGVEGETLSCGTGVTACAIAADIISEGRYNSHTKIHTQGGQLEVTFNKKGNVYTNVWLIGPAVQVFSGHIQI